MSHNSGNSGFTAIVSFLAGAAAGAVTGILFAPDKGANTRERIVERTKEVGTDAKDDVNEKMDSLKSYINDFMDEVKGRFTELEKDMKQRAEEAKNEAAKTVEKKAKQAQS